jgi:HEPN domain-containing protein
MQEPVEKYIQACDDDLEAAAILVKGGHYFYVPFLCHQALNKIFRGYFLEVLNRYPPLTGDLLAIADDTEIGLRLEEDERAFVASLKVYPEVIGNPVYRQKILDRNSKNHVEGVLEKTTAIAEMVRGLF